MLVIMKGNEEIERFPLSAGNAAYAYWKRFSDPSVHIVSIECRNV